MTKTCFGNIIIFVTSFNKFVINEKEKVMIGDYMTNQDFEDRRTFLFLYTDGSGSAGKGHGRPGGPQTSAPCGGWPEEPEIIIAGRKDTEDQAGASMLIQVEDENTEVYSEPDTESQVVGQAEAGGYIRRTGNGRRSVGKDLHRRIRGLSEHCGSRG